MLSNKVHTLIVIHFLYLLHLSSAYEVLNSFYGSINAGDVNYYTLESTTPVIIALYSIEGDADMYGSPTSKNSKPSSESSDYMSTSCGLDVMILPMSKQVKKMSVGIYGHVRHQNTSYHLSVIAPKDDDILRYQVWLGWLSMYLILGLVPRVLIEATLSLYLIHLYYNINIMILYILLSSSYVRTHIRAVPLLIFGPPLEL